MFVLRTSLALLLVASVGGCAEQSSEPDPTGPGGDTLEGKLSNNGLRLDQVTLNLLSTKVLTAELAPNSEELFLNETAFGSLLQASGGAELLSYVTTCALDEGQQLRVESTGQVFSGNLGLATEWAGEECDQSCQRWVSACLLAHSNALGNSVVISPRGSNPGLVWDDEISRDFSYQEAAFYGNVFGPQAERSMQACAGAGLLAGATEGNAVEQALLDGAEFLAGRICGVGACGFEFAGLCQDTLVIDLPQYVDTGACTTYEAGYYFNCEEEVSGTFPEDLPDDGSLPGDELDQEGIRYAEVITVYLDR